MTDVDASRQLAGTARAGPPSGTPIIAVYRLEEPRRQAADGQPPYHEWTLADGRLWTEFHRLGPDFLLRFPGLADFRVAADGRTASCTPAPGTPEETCRHLYLNQVLPLMLSRQGRLVFHASAVALGDGAVAFLAGSGRGKSTLAAAFAAAGARFLTDDALVLEATAEGCRVLPGHPSIRLREDSRRALAGEEPADDLHGAKARLAAGARLPHRDGPLPLRAAYVLGEDTDEIAFQRLAGVEALTEWMRHAFVLDPDDRAGLAEHFAGVGGLAAAVPCSRLDYPRRFDALERLRRAIADDATAAGPGQ